MIASMHSASSFTSRSPTPDLRQWTLAPPRSSIEMSSPVTALVRCGPGERHRALADDHRHEVGEARGCRRCPAAQGPSIAGDHAARRRDIITSSRKRWPEPANSDPVASWIRAPAESSSQISGIRFCSAISRRRPTLISPVIPIEPAITVKS